MLYYNKNVLWVYLYKILAGMPEACKNEDISIKMARFKPFKTAIRTLSILHKNFDGDLAQNVSCDPENLVTFKVTTWD
jgi:hypothetical protein